MLRNRVSLQLPVSVSVCTTHILVRRSLQLEAQQILNFMDIVVARRSRELVANPHRSAEVQTTFKRWRRHHGMQYVLKMHNAAKIEVCILNLFIHGS